MANIGWKLLAAGAGMAAGIVAQKLTDGTWRFVSGDSSPTQPEDPDIDWKQAVAFAVFSGAVVGLTRMLATREAAKAYRKSTGHLPEDYEKKS